MKYTYDDYISLSGNLFKLDINPDDIKGSDYMNFIYLYYDNHCTIKNEIDSYILNGVLATEKLIIMYLEQILNDVRKISNHIKNSKPVDNKQISRNTTVNDTIVNSKSTPKNKFRLHTFLV